MYARMNLLTKISIMSNSLKHKIILSFLCFFSTFPLIAQQSFPMEDGDCAYYDFSMSTPNTELSGLCILMYSGNTIKASIVNEFGATFMDYSFNVRKSKIKLHYVFEKLDKWYIRRVLKRNLKKIMIAMRAGENSYSDKRHKLNYTFTINHDIKQ